MFKAQTVALILSLAFLAIPSVVAQSCSSLDAVQWMLGDWLADGRNTMTHETWWRVSPQTFEGESKAIRKATPENPSTETLRLVEMSGEIFYLAKVAHNERPIPFKARNCTKDSVVFENPDHDFPKQLEYHRISSDSLRVVVSDGGSQGFMLRFARRVDR